MACEEETASVAACRAVGGELGRRGLIVGSGGDQQSRGLELRSGMWRSNLARRALSVKTSRDPSTAQLVSKLASKLAHKLWKPATTRQKDMLALNRQMAGPEGYVGICKGFANVFAEGIECHNKVLTAQIKYLAHILSGLQGKFQEVADTPQYDAALRPAALCSILSKGNPLDKIRSEWAQKHCGVELPKDLQLSQPLMDTLDALVKLTYFPPWWAEADESFIEDGIAKLVTADKLLVEEFDRLKPHLLQKLRVEELDRLKPHLLQKLPLKSLIV